jgi:cytochrome c peroxidase
LVGTPEELGTHWVHVTAADGAGLRATADLQFNVESNSVPTVVASNEDIHVPVNSLVDLDVTQAGRVFSDPDGDTLTYEVALRGQSQHLSTDSTRVHGTLESVGLVEVTVTANDGYGATATDLFVIAAPGPEEGAPVLPAMPFTYADEQLELPYAFRNSSDDRTPSENRTTNAGATLGRVLFYDKRLSSTNTVACASCHQQNHGFTIADRFAIGALGIPTRRNPLGLGNVRFNRQVRWFWDMRSRSLQDLVLIPIQNPEELGSSLGALESKLASTEFYPPLFEAAFGTPEVTAERISKALAQFLQALISYSSRYNLAYTPMFNGSGDPSSVLTAQELRGAEIFEGVGRCSLCHDPTILVNVWQANNGLDAVITDPGAQDLHMQRGDTQGVFRSASLMNIALTGPYMHDGRFATLREVIDHYDHNVQESEDLDNILRVGNSEPRRLNLSEEDKLALEAFLNTFTDTAFLQDPKFSDPFITAP